MTETHTLGTYMSDQSKGPRDRDHGLDRGLGMDHRALLRSACGKPRFYVQTGLEAGGHVQVQTKGRVVGGVHPGNRQLSALCRELKNNGQMTESGSALYEYHVPTILTVWGKIFLIPKIFC